MATVSAERLLPSGPRYLNGVPLPEVGWFGGDIYRSAKKAVKKVGKAAGSVVHVASDVIDAPRALSVGLIKRTSLGRQIVRGVNQVGHAYAAVAPVLAQGASFVPGLGSGVASALSGSAALASGKSLAQAAKAAAIGSIPGGAAAYQAALAVGDLASGKNVLKTVTSRAASYGLQQVGVPAAYQQTVLAIASGKPVTQAAQQAAMRALGADRFATAVHTVAELGRSHTSPARIGNVLHSAAGQSRLFAPGSPASGFGAVRPHSWAGNVASAIRSATGRDVGALDPAGKVWVIQTGDTASKIAKACTGNANRWPELKAANPTWKNGWTAAQIKTYGYPVRLGQRIVLPSSWVAAAPAVTPVPVAVKVSSSPATAVPVAPAAVAPSDDTRAKMQARLALSYWSQTDGLPAGSDITYGVTVGDIANEIGPVWSARDTAAARLFEQWGATRGYLVGETDGLWSQALYSALSRWAAAKASAQTAAVIKDPSTIPALITAAAPVAVTRVNAAATVALTNLPAAVAATVTAAMPPDAVMAAPSVPQVPVAIPTAPTPSAATPVAAEPAPPGFFRRNAAPLLSVAAGVAANYIGPMLK